MGELIEVAEQEIVIDFKLGCKCRAKIGLKSLSGTHPVAFKVQTSAPEKFLVNPPNGIIPPAASASFQVILRPQTQLPPSFPKSPSDRFLIKAALAPFDADHGHLHLYFSSDTHDVKLRVVFVGLLLLRRAVAAGDVDAVRNIVRRQRSLLPGLSPRHAASLIDTAPDAIVLAALKEAGLRRGEGEMGADGEGDEVRSKGWTPLHAAAVSDRVEAVEALLGVDDREERLESRDKHGRTPLHLAAGSGQLQCARRLVEAGADKNARSGDGRTPLFFAAENGDAKMVALLLNMGADAAVEAAAGVSPLDVARDKGHEKAVDILEQGELLLRAARRGDVPLLKSLLEKPIFNLNFCDQYGLTALHSAAIKGHAKVLAMLIEAGMEIECRDVEGHTPLHLAVEGGSAEVVEALLHRGANVNARSRRGATPLFMATSMGYDAISRILRHRMAASSSLLSSSSSTVSSL